MPGTGNITIHIPVNSAGYDIAHQQGVKPLHNLLIQSQSLRDTVLHVSECLLMIHLLINLPKLFPADGDSILQHQLSLN